MLPEYQSLSHEEMRIEEEYPHVAEDAELSRYLTSLRLNDKRSEAATTIWPEEIKMTPLLRGQSRGQQSYPKSTLSNMPSLATSYLLKTALQLQ